MIITDQGISNNQEEQVSPFLRTYFGPISSIGTGENSPEIVVTKRDSIWGLAVLVTKSYFAAMKYQIQW